MPKEDLLELILSTGTFIANTEVLVVISIQRHITNIEAGNVTCALTPETTARIPELKHHIEALERHFRDF